MNEKQGNLAEVQGPHLREQLDALVKRFRVKRKALLYLSLATNPKIDVYRESLRLNRHKRDYGSSQANVDITLMEPTMTFKSTRIEQIAPGSLKPNPRNPRTHSRKQMRQIEASIRRYGFINPIIIDNQRLLLAGHARVEAAVSLGLSEVPCIQLDLGSSE